MSALGRIRALPHYVRNLVAYRRLSSNGEFPISLRDLWYRAHDRYARAGTAQGHYFFQDLWAAQRLCEWGAKSHVDVASRMDGFIAHLLPFCAVTYVDIRPLDLDWSGFSFRRGSITQMPFESGSLATLSSLHVIEHIGLGRYGDEVDPLGYRKAAAELARVLAVGGRLLIGAPVGRERLCFDAHRVFDPATLVRAFEGLEVKEFSLIVDDGARGILRDASFDRARRCDYGCGLFVFEKPSR